MVEGFVKLFLLEFDHGSEVEVLAEFFGGFVEFGVVDAVDIFFDGDDFFHDVDAFDVLALSEEGVTFFWRISHLLVSCVIFYLKSASIATLFYLTIITIKFSYILLRPSPAS